MNNTKFKNLSAFEISNKVTLTLRYKSDTSNLYVGFTKEGDYIHYNIGNSQTNVTSKAYSVELDPPEGIAAYSEHKYLFVEIIENDCLKALGELNLWVSKIQEVKGRVGEEIVKGKRKPIYCLRVHNEWRKGT